MRFGIDHAWHRKAERDAINLPLLQLTEERAHLSPRRLRSIGYSRHYVESGMTRLFRLLGEIRIRLIARR
jgi:hypothetical protein